jgi:hypothetical protein
MNTTLVRGSGVCCHGPPGADPCRWNTCWPRQLRDTTVGLVTCLHNCNRLLKGKQDIFMSSAFLLRQCLWGHFWCGWLHKIATLITGKKNTFKYFHIKCDWVIASQADDGSHTVLLGLFGSSYGTRWNYDEDHLETILCNGQWYFPTF